jgi:hypothetical protein
VSLNLSPAKKPVNRLVCQILLFARGLGIPPSFFRPKSIAIQPPFVKCANDDRPDHNGLAPLNTFPARQSHCRISMQKHGPQPGPARNLDPLRALPQG